MTGFVDRAARAAARSRPSDQAEDAGQVPLSQESQRPSDPTVSHPLASDPFLLRIRKISESELPVSTGSIKGLPSRLTYDGTRPSSLLHLHHHPSLRTTVSKALLHPLSQWILYQRLCSLLLSPAKISTPTSCNWSRVLRRLSSNLSRSTITSACKPKSLQHELVKVPLSRGSSRRLSDSLRNTHDQ
jgi:hypothetical protein